MPVSPAEAAATLASRRAARRELGRKRSEVMAPRLATVARILRECGATSVRLFGSFATGEAGPESDVDLAVLGLPRSRYFDSLAQARRELGAPVDLVRLEDAPPSLRERGAAEGREL